MMAILMMSYSMMSIKNALLLNKGREFRREQAFWKKMMSTVE